jgi:hypothetical protein
MHTFSLIGYWAKEESWLFYEACDWTVRDLYYLKIAYNGTDIFKMYNRDL